VFNCLNLNSNFRSFILTFEQKTSSKSIAIHQFRKRGTSLKKHAWCSDKEVERERVSGRSFSDESKSLKLRNSVGSKQIKDNCSNDFSNQGRDE
jgi:phage-related protein